MNMIEVINVSRETSCQAIDVMNYYIEIRIIKIMFHVKHDHGGNCLRKILFIINPVAGKGETIQIFKKIKKEFSEYNYDTKLTKSIGDATQITRKYMNCYTDIISVGGDGTLTEIVDGLKNYEGNLGVIAAGTGNDFIRSLNYPESLERCFEIIKAGKSQKIDVLKVNNHRFINVASFGLDGEVILQTDKIKQKISGTSAYVVSSIKSILKFKPYPVIVEIDGEPLKREIVLVAVGNGMYFGGGMNVTPCAKINDGFLDVVIANKTSKLKLINLFVKLFKGQHMNDSIIEHYKCKSFSIESDLDILINADGNLIGQLPAKISVDDDKINIIIP